MQAKNATIYKKLVEELKRLQRLLNHGEELKIEWEPGKIRRNGKQRLCGEVIGKTIYIYEENETEALNTLRHEMIEHLLSTFEKNYIELVNSLIQVFNEIQKRKREHIVDKLAKIVTTPELRC